MAVLAAVGVAAIIDQFWQIGWRGFLQYTVSIWERTVRPAVAWICHLVVTIPLGWIGVHIVVPEWLRDYLSVGLILGLSIARMQRNDRAPLRALLVLDRSDLLSSLAFWLPLIVVLWPLHLLLYVAMFWMSAVNPGTRDSSVSKSMAAAVAPLLYLGLLLAVNYLLL